MELMSPAGNFKSFIAALESGADSIYLGLKRFNARKPANNFTIQELKKTVEIAHQENKKIYLTLNIDLKPSEIKESIQILELSKELNVDAVIIKDLALVHLIQKFYSKDITFHHSTQNAICSSYGVKFAKSQGSKRIVLARELELEEISKASLIKGIEVEIFVEGSMCFSISGRCLMSSWVGGRSGNRGTCTAPCRVVWKSNAKEDTYFSMKDLTLIKDLNNLKNTNVSSLKIEGRLKNENWVRTITSIYRKALDKVNDNDELEDLFDELKQYSARERSNGHINGHEKLTGKNEEWDKYRKPAEIRSDNSKYLSKSNEIYIDLKDGSLKIEFKIDGSKEYLEIHIPPSPKKAKPQPIYNLKELLDKNISEETKIILSNDLININLPSSFIKKTYKDILNKISNIKKNNERLPELSIDFQNYIQPKELIKKREHLLGEVPDKIIIFSKDIHKLSVIPDNIYTIVLSLNNIPNQKNLDALNKKVKTIISIPPVLYEKEADKMKDLINSLYLKGFKEFEANSYTGFQILKDLDCNKYCGPEFPIMNQIASDYLYNNDFNSVYASSESDISLLKALTSFTKGRLELVTFGRSTLFISRVKSNDFADHKLFRDKFNVEIECFQFNDLNYFVSTKPFSFISNNIKEENIYFDSTTADLRFFNDPIKTYSEILNNKFNKDTTSSFNFYRKLV